MARKKQKWQVGDYFGIPIEDDFLAVGQILGKYDWIGVACLITKMKISSKNLFTNRVKCSIIIIMLLADS